MSTLLEVERVTKQFALPRRAPFAHRDVLTAVQDVSFTLEEGRTLAVVGESGAGKSTLISLVLRLIVADSGSIRFRGADVATLRGAALLAFRRDTAIIFQDPYASVDPRMTAAQAIEEPLRVHTSLGRSERAERAMLLLHRVGLADVHAMRFPHELSGGQLQRVAIARALSTSPKLLVCDEAVSSLDVSTRAQIINLLLALQEEERVSYLFVSHDLSLVRHIADWVLVMHHGEVREAGAMAAVWEQPQHPYTRSLLASLPRLYGAARSHAERPASADPSRTKEGTLS